MWPCESETLVMALGTDNSTLGRNRATTAVVFVFFSRAVLLHSLPFMHYCRGFNLLISTWMHKSRAPDLASCRLSGAQNFEAAPRFLKKLYILWLVSLLGGFVTEFPVRFGCTLDTLAWNTHQCIDFPRFISAFRRALCHTKCTSTKNAQMEYCFPSF